MQVPNLIVQKYGGSSLAEPGMIRAVALQIAELRKRGKHVLVVVSAMGKTTDQLTELAYKISSRPNRRELDMLLSTGERVSMALMSMALHDLQVPSISFTGSQAGILTDESHSQARILSLKPIRIESELAKNRVIVLAGFQGVSPETKEITTLGRGGSDTTAVAMAAHFEAEVCEICKDVDGIYSADPHLVKTARHLPKISYNALLEMTYWGAKVLHYRSVELAALLKIPMQIRLSHGDGQMTEINAIQTTEIYEQERVLSVNSHKDVRFINVEAKTLSEAYKKIEDVLNKANLPWPQILDTENHDRNWCFWLTAPTEHLNALAQAMHENKSLEVSEPGFACVAATCQGAYTSGLSAKICTVLDSRGIQVEKMLFSPMSVSIILPDSQSDQAIQILHSLC